MKNSSSNQRWVSLIILSALCIAIAFTICGCGNGLSGNWVCEGESEPGYPDSMTLKSNGTGVADGYSISWHVDGDEMTITTMFGSDSCQYRRNGSTLYLDDHVYHKR